MHKIIYFFAATLLVVSCKKKTSTPTTNSNSSNNNSVVLDSSSASSSYYLSATFDSKSWGGYESTKNNLQFGYSEGKAVNTQTNVLDMELSTNLMKIDPKSETLDYLEYLEVAVRSINLDYTKFYSDDSLFYSLFSLGNMNFAQGDGSGFRVSYVSRADSIEWTTTAGSQIGSVFNITSIKKMSDLISTYVTIKGTYSCKLYNKSNPSVSPKVVTNGMFNLNIVK